MISSFHQQLMILFSLLLFFICIVHSSQVNIDEQNSHGKVPAHNQNAAAAATRLDILKQILSRRSLYDPAFGDSWSNYFEKKRELFDPAYSDWSNSFKRSDQNARH